jgi:hypothetical protein
VASPLCALKIRILPFLFFFHDLRFASRYDRAELRPGMRASKASELTRSEGAGSSLDRELTRRQHRRGADPGGLAPSLRRGAN